MLRVLRSPACPQPRRGGHTRGTCPEAPCRACPRSRQGRLRVERIDATIQNPTDATPPRKSFPPSRPSPGHRVFLRPGRLVRACVCICMRKPLNESQSPSACHPPLPLSSPLQPTPLFQPTLTHLSPPPVPLLTYPPPGGPRAGSPRGVVGVCKIVLHDDRMFIELFDVI